MADEKKTVTVTINGTASYAIRVEPGTGPKALELMFANPGLWLTTVSGRKIRATAITGYHFNA